MTSNKFMDDPTDDEYFWDRFIYRLVKAGYGDYEAAANADLVEAAVFLLMKNSKDELVYNWLMN